MDKIIFGDNQFFGVNHMSEEKARTQAIKFQSTTEILSILKAANECGVKTFMCTTHDRMADIASAFRSAPQEFPEQQIYPCMPYAHKYANAMSEQGVLTSLRQFMPEDGLVDALVRGGRSLAKRDVEGMITLLIDAEMKPYRGSSTPVIFLQNVVVDLLLGLGFDDAFRIFSDHVTERYGAEPGFISMNLPILLATLRRVGIENPIVCANINKIGFRMSGGIERYVEALRREECRVIAMSVYASGAIPPKEAIDWVAGLPNISSILFGASSRTNIESTVELVRSSGF